MTRSKELRRIEAAITHRNEAELRWALAQCELRRRFTKDHSALWYQIEMRVLAALEEIRAESK
jgi:hypothetical protein